ncbi:167_t:CDS:2 [Funneliformis caledonium]|uniref:167_t:CDS:1 n=1 Tax=Funneliformis caledonium TaxID=1117310 RepID=A0A9N8VEQ5_9GLOM|nr:167_t:CDS:2 [Funneliformis caledonium]
MYYKKSSGVPSWFQGLEDQWEDPIEDEREEYHNPQEIFDNYIRRSENEPRGEQANEKEDKGVDLEEDYNYFSSSLENLLF